MDFDSITASYIAQHWHSLDADSIRHLKNFSARLESGFHEFMSKVKGEPVQLELELKSDLEAGVKTTETKIESDVKTVESAAEEVKEHSEHAFADLLKAQADKIETTKE